MSQSARRSCDADYPLMLIIPSGVKIHMALGHTDMRKGFDSLAVLVQEVRSRVISSPSAAERPIR
jgi:hypothetical protein